MCNDKFVNYRIKILARINWTIFRNRNWKLAEFAQDRQSDTINQYASSAAPDHFICDSFHFSVQGLEPQNHSVGGFIYVSCSAVSTQED